MDRRSITSAENGKKYGGRPKGPATIEREKARAYIAEKIGEYMPQLFDVLIKNALKGDMTAIKELFDRGFGRATQAIDLTGDLSIKIGKLEEMREAIRAIAEKKNG